MSEIKNPLFLRTEMLIGSEPLTRLEAAHVAVFGLGGVGSFVAEALARTGVGALTLIDHDDFSETNRNRQLSALQSTLGKSKAKITALRLLDINPDIRVRAIPEYYEEKAKERFFDTGYSYIADCIDLVSCKLSLIMEARSRDIPILSALGTGNKLNLLDLRVSDISETRMCPLARVVRKELKKRGVFHHTVVYSEEPAREPLPLEAPPPGRRSIPASAVFVPAAAGLLMAETIVKALIEAR